MSDRDFILNNYNSFIDNVLLNKSPEFWSRCFVDDDGGIRDGYMKQTLSSDVSAWRRRLEAEQNKLPKGYNPYPKTTAKEKCENAGHDPDHTEEWWAAIDADVAYQEEQNR